MYYTWGCATVIIVMMLFGFVILTNCCLQDDFSRDSLYEAAKKQVICLRDELTARKTRLPENVHYDFLLNWLLAVRGMEEQ